MFQSIKKAKVISLLIASVMLPAAMQSQATDTKAAPEKEPAWSVNAPQGVFKEVNIDVTSGTWMSVDVSPDGNTLVFDFLGDIYLMDIDGGEAKPLMTDIAWQMQPRFSPG